MPAMIRWRLRRRTTMGLILLGTSGLVGLAPGLAQFGGGKPQIPPAPVLSVYQQTISTEKLTIAPVSAGLGPIGPAMPDQLADTGINPALYTGTLAGLQTYVRAIASVGPRPDIVPRVRFKLDPHPNAFAVSEEEIQLTTGMFKLVQENIKKNPDAVQQLLFLLCHEYGHVLYDHPRLYATKNKEVGIARFAGTAIKIATTMNSLSAKTNGGAMFDRTALGTMQGTLALSPIIENEIYRVSFAPYHKEQESLADFAAADLMKKLQRGDARDAIGILSVFEQYDNSLIGQLKQGLKNLGDSMKQSMDQLGKTAPALMLKSGPGAVMQQARAGILKSILSTVAGILERRTSKNSAHLYFSQEKRADAVKTYADKYYPREAAVASSETTNAWAGRFKVTPPAQLAETFDREYGPDEAAQKARMLLLQQDGPGARALLDAAKAKFAASATTAPAVVAVAKAPTHKGKKPGTAPKKAAAAPAPTIKSAFFHTVDAETYTFAGDIPNAILAYRRAIELPEVSVKAFLDLAALQNLAGEPAAALATLDKGGRMFGEDKVVLAKINQHLAHGEIDAAKALLPSCSAYPALAKSCADAISQHKDDDGDD